MATRAKKKRLAKRAQHPPRPSKDDQIRDLGFAITNLERLRAENVRDLGERASIIDAVTHERDKLRGQLERLRDEAARQIGYIQRVQEDDMAKSDRKTVQITEASSLYETGSGVPAKMITKSEAVRQPVHFGPIEQTVNPRSIAEQMRQGRL